MASLVQDGGDCQCFGLSRGFLLAREEIGAIIYQQQMIAIRRRKTKMTEKLLLSHFILSTHAHMHQNDTQSPRKEKEKVTQCGGLNFS